ncbi:HD-GYP domain-containing protein, partial [Acidovorax sp.]|uniref:HD-GYP domain-containing protein n=1 Tax=Acidovorax sp. TaxID=1872122 RepID=UPI00391F82CE
MYSGTHSMLVACVCMVVAREMLRWPAAHVQVVGQAALSMNIAMTELQDQLAQQMQPLTSAQIAAVEDHAARSEALLRELGVHSELWLEAVRHHHHRSPGAFSQKSPGLQMARLIQRADVFGARLAPRAARSPMPVTAAMQASYYDEEQKVDEAGAALVKALGIYPPGAFVKLASQEVAVVLRRGASGTTPRVAVVTNRLGMPTGELIPRDTAQPQWKIVGVVAHKDVRVKLSLNRLLPLV